MGYITRYSYGSSRNEYYVEKYQPLHRPTRKALIHGTPTTGREDRAIYPIKAKS